MARILIVDHHRLLRRVAERLLRSAGHEVSTAADAVSADREMQRFHPWLVIADESFEKCDGTDWVLDLRRNAPDLKVLVMSAATEAFGHPEPDENLQPRSTAVLQKPFHMSELLREVEAVLIR
jgi:DNA-binding response OmpR family regulator